MEQGRLREEINKVFKGDIIDSFEKVGEVTVVVSEDAFYRLAEYVYSNPELKFNFMSNMTVVDYLDTDFPYGTRFIGVYHLYSMDFGFRLRIKVPISDAARGVKSVTSLWKAANFFEREAYDMFGVRYEGHPDLRRIYMPEGFDGHPLRKDYPLSKEG